NVDFLSAARRCAPATTRDQRVVDAAGHATLEARLPFLQRHAIPTTQDGSIGIGPAECLNVASPRWHNPMVPQKVSRGPGRPVAAKADDTRQRIISAARQVFSERGYD